MLKCACMAGVGLCVFVAASVLALCAQSKGVLHRHSEQAGHPEFFSALGTEPAWPYLRQDLRRWPETDDMRKDFTHIS